MLKKTLANVRLMIYKIEFALDTNLEPLETDLV
jgi:hypothetical protein